jgi:tryptophan-rich sensory protein
VQAYKPLLALLFHLSVGDTWNTITNVERRLGVSTLGCGIVALSVYFTVWEFWKANKLAGLILLPSALWITVACKLTFDIWRLNDSTGSRPDGREPLFPISGDGKGSTCSIENSFLGWGLAPLRKGIGKSTEKKKQ